MKRRYTWERISHSEYNAFRVYEIGHPEQTVAYADTFDEANAYVDELNRKYSKPQRKTWVGLKPRKEATKRERINRASKKHKNKEIDAE